MYEPAATLVEFDQAGNRCAVQAVPREFDREDLDGKLNVLELPLSQWYERIFELVLHLTGRVFGKANPARRRKRLNTRGNIDAIAVNIRFAMDDITNMETYADQQRMTGKSARVAFMQSSLDLDCATAGVEGAREFYEESISNGLDLRTFVRSEKRTEQRAMLFKKRQRSLLILLSEGAVADHVGEHDGGESSCAIDRRAGILRCHAVALSILSFDSKVNAFGFLHFRQYRAIIPPLHECVLGHSLQLVRHPRVRRRYTYWRTGQWEDSARPGWATRSFCPAQKRYACARAGKANLVPFVVNGGIRTGEAHHCGAQAAPFERPHHRQFLLPVGFRSRAQLPLRGRHYVYTFRFRGERPKIHRSCQTGCGSHRTVRRLAEPHLGAGPTGDSDLSCKCNDAGRLIPIVVSPSLLPQGPV